MLNGNQIEFTTRKQNMVDLMIKYGHRVYWIIILFSKETDQVKERLNIKKKKYFPYSNPQR